MELVVKTFDELTRDELYDIFRLRVDVFVAEQKCPYHEIDDADKAAVHVFLRDDEGIEAYLRVLPAGVLFTGTGIGRVIAKKRRQGLGTRVLAAGIETAKTRFGADSVTVEAQTYARSFYEKAGFVQTSEEFLEDGIPHIKMELRI